ncbi:hypothetical protein Hthe01_18770 [Hydrogenophilus thermoluteolus]|uniref:photosystem II protein Y n=1 Tax=Hydrogenophilus thermoluteolus TaxID=297 RepID=UPI0024A1E940|nr:photosystem II protein Y [Hydrogenophilus thermoluteolus]GLW61528.1 hypothetical protein Hthe01_18770 [Hydrogenophilus thermoluteolus]
MVRLIAQLALVATAIGWAVSNIGNGGIGQIADSIRSMTRALGKSGVPGGEEAASAIEKGMGLQQAAPTAPASYEPPDLPFGERPKAFYNELPKECYWEKVIEPSTGRVECSVPEREKR